MTFCLVRCACSTSQRKSALSISDLWRRDLQARRPQGWEAWLAGTERLQIRGSIAGGRTAVAGEPELWNIGNDARQGRYSRPHKQTVSRLHAPGLLASGHRLQSTFDDVHHSRSRSFSKRATTEPSSPHDGTTSRLTSRASQEGTVREEGGDAVSPDVRKKLGNLEYELEIDPFVHMLAAPLRRCVLTSAILPVC
ncbi:hypothetical protein IE81DRAFT_236398 [Ceraceosorus guamensis]|uniref:Uncharacterized protein n=1 Tax=Ceraceosorus guamensis TaxID=1522189 RepID=A0A316VUV5_9BASI|nr:hypothetical protein IE81DRAFT_236398 [Ceraceosorus guamensis]PWN40203.1 hypothetical protein IE81DRAFT_236398 [Ceraceosorus guamensis]